MNHLANVTVLSEKPETFTVWRFWSDVKLTDKAHLDTREELEQWAMGNLFPVIKVTRDSDGMAKLGTLHTDMVETSEGVEPVNFYKWESLS